MRAYPEIYLSKVQGLLGDALDYAVNCCKLEGSDFIKLFCASQISKRIENGEPAYLAGKSGIELAWEIVAETTGKQLEVKPQERFERSAAYWIGWAVAYYQWRSDRKFIDIFQAVSFTELQKMYGVLHEADVSKFADRMDARMSACFPETNLKRIRSAYGCSQAELSKSSGVSLRSIQMYEQRNKDINKAGADQVYRLARQLGCTMEELLER